MKSTVEVAFDSLTKKKITGDEYTELYLAIDGDGYTLQLTPDSLSKLKAAITPFITGEDASVTPEVHYALQKRAARKSDQPSPQERAAIAAFVEKQKLGKVNPTGRVRRAFIEAWVAAGRPMK